MTDAQTRELERAAAQGDDEARLALGAQRVREGRCPWCNGEADEDSGCCCMRCFREELRLARRSGGIECEGCPAEHIDDEQSKEDK